MFNWLHNFFTSEIKSLESILKPFHSMWADLEGFIQKSEQLIGIKKQQITDLQSQIDQHTTDQQQAQAVQTAVGSILNNAPKSN